METYTAYSESPVAISSCGKEIRLKHLADLLALCSSEDAMDLQVALQRTINVHLEWHRDYAQQEADMCKEKL